MCIIETKTYDHADGRREIIEPRRRCRDARGTGLCSNVIRRNVEQASIVEHRPATTDQSDNAVLITQSRGGRETVYQDVAKRTSRRSSIRRSRTVTINRPFPVDSRSSTSSSSFVEMRPPPAPSPPPSGAVFPAPGVSRRPTLSDEPVTRRIESDGTAIYDRPPSLEQPRTLDNERRPRFVEVRPTRRGSLSSTTAELGDPAPRLQHPRPRRPNIVVDTSTRPPSASSPSATSPGLSQLPRLSGSRRHDSARDLPGRRPRGESNSESRRRQQSQTEEDERQARLERERLAESERRQEARRNAALNSSAARRDASVDRHRRDAAAALEGEREQRREQRERQADLDAELAQVRREREVSEARRRDSDDAARYYERSISPRTSRRTTGESFAPYTSSPLSTRSPTHPVMVHQEYTPLTSSGRRGSSLHERGAAVIAREQMRADREPSGSRDRTRRESQRMNSMIREGALDEQYDVDLDHDIDDYYLDEGLQRGDSRRVERDAERVERRREFWRR